MRIHSGPLKSIVESEAAVLDSIGVLQKAPETLGGKSLSHLLANGTVKVDVDRKYPQAVGIASIMHQVSVFGNSPWEILHNYETDSPFFTSDYPATIEVTDLNTPINRIIPLAPDIAVRIMPDVNLSDNTNPNGTAFVA
jgi:hypothetical protein